MASAADVPTKFDLVINGQGYMLDKSYDDSPYRTPPAEYSSTPTFLERTNVGSAYGDDQQAFFLTASQNDWVGGEGKRFFRSADSNSIREFWRGENIDSDSVPGQITLAPGVATSTMAGAVSACIGAPEGVYVASATNLYLIDLAGDIIDKGAHGLGAAPYKWGMAHDGHGVYMSATGTNIRLFVPGSGFSNFNSSAAGSDSLAYLGNILYGYELGGGKLVSYSTGGVPTDVYTWKDAGGNALAFNTFETKLITYGGKLVILRTRGVQAGASELWQYDGSNASQTAGFPPNFVAKEMIVVAGTVVVSGYFISNVTNFVPAIFAYASGSLDLIWKSNVRNYSTTNWPALATYGPGFAFTDDTTGHFMVYNTDLGAASAVGTYTPTNAQPMLASAPKVVLHTRESVTAYSFPSTGQSTSGYVVTSLIDFDNSLLKLIRGIKVEFESGTDGDGGSVDISYQLDSVDGSYTSLQVGAASGTEYLLPDGQHHSISVKVTLHLGSSTFGPKLKRIYVRGAPILQAFKQRRYLIDLIGNKRANPPQYVTLVNGDTHSKDGDEMRADLVTAISAGIITITDRMGSFTGIIEPGSTSLREVRSDYGRAEYRADVVVREI